MLRAFRVAVVVGAGVVGAASDSLTCLESPLSPSLAARYHRLEALRVYAIPDEDAARQALLAARAADPAYGSATVCCPETTA